MNGTTTLRPAGSVSLYFPKRSTMPARACGMIRTVLASRTTTKSRTTSANPSRNGIGTPLRPGGRKRCGSWLEPADGVDVGGRALDGEHLDRLADGDGQGLVIGLRCPG